MCPKNTHFHQSLYFIPSVSIYDDIFHSDASELLLISVSARLYAASGTREKLPIYSCILSMEIAAKKYCRKHYESGEAIVPGERHKLF
jgi:hypothetical protein